MNQSRDAFRVEPLKTMGQSTGDRPKGLAVQAELQSILERTRRFESGRRIERKTAKVTAPRGRLR